MFRREVLRMVGASIIISSVGCIGDNESPETGEGSNSPDSGETESTESPDGEETERTGPAGTVKEFATAIDGGDKGEAETLLHEDSVFFGEDVVEYEVEDLEVTQQKEESATVNATAHIKADDDDGSVAITSERETFDLDWHDDKWLIVQGPLVMPELELDSTEIEEADLGMSGSADDLELVEHELVRENEGEVTETVSVVGSVENTADSDVSSARVDVEFLDESNDVVRTTFTTVDDISPEETQEFEVSSSRMGESAAKIVEYDLSIQSIF